MYGIGPVTARRLYDNGLRTIDDLRNYYGVDEFEDDDLSDSKIEADESNDVKVGLSIYKDVSVSYVGNFSRVIGVHSDATTSLGFLETK